MIRPSVLAVLLCLMLFRYVAAAPDPAGGEKEKNPETNAAVPSIPAPDDFMSCVRKAGGSVDFVFGDDRPFPQCHASTIVEAEDGTLLCAWFGGQKEKAPDVGIWLSRYADGQWTSPVEVAKLNETPHWNPVLFRDPARGTYLFFKSGREIPFWETVWMKTADSGKTWSSPAELVPFDQGGRGPVKNKPILLSDGAWLAGASTEYKQWNVFSDRSEDGGKTWIRSADVDSSGVKTIQPALWESEPGKVHMLTRTTAGRIGRADSIDGGRTWSTLYLTGLPNNNSGIDLLKLEDGRLLLVYNPADKNKVRTPLSLALSTNDGDSWTILGHLETGPDNEFSYPSIVRTSEGVAVTYTWKRQRIRCWQIPLSVF